MFSGVKMDCENRRTSFLRAKDSTITDEYLTFESIRINLAQAKDQEGFTKNQVPGCMQIYLRIKKSNEQSDELYEANERTIACMAPGDEFVRKYKFSRIFKADSTQADLFNTIVKPKLFEFMNGKSSSLFAYGASGSGKTFTIVGSVAQPGIIPRTLEYLFTSLPDIIDNITFKPDVMDNIIFLNPVAQKEQKRIHDQLLDASRSTISTHHVHEYKAMQQRLRTEPSATVEDQEELFLGIWVSFAEIYNESVYDLLKPQASKKKPREKLAVKMSDIRPYLKGLTVVNVSSSLEAYQILQYGLHNLKYASTCVNAHSSRSHSIFTIKLIQGSMKTKEYIISYFNFCDLAGSERLKRTLNTGERLKESNSINTSLLVLGKCIRSILSSQKSRDNKPVPYRESKLTQLFQRALRGLEDIAMIVNMNPDKEVFEETLHALNFSAIAREIEVTKVGKIVRQMENGTSQDDAEIAQLEDQVSELYAELEAREADHQDKMIRVRSEMLNEYMKVVASANKEYEGEIKRIQQYYDNMFEEEVERLTKKYEAMSTNENDIINLDSSEDEDFAECNKGNEECVNYSDDVIVLTSSEDEEDLKECDLEVKSSLIEAQNHGDNYKSDVIALNSFEGEKDFNEHNEQSWKDFESESTDDDDFSLNTTKTTDERLSESVKTQPKINKDEFGDDAYSLTECKSVSIDYVDFSLNTIKTTDERLSVSVKTQPKINKDEFGDDAYSLTECKSVSIDYVDFSLNTIKTTDERLSVSVKTQPKINKDEFDDDAYSLTESKSESIDKLICETSADWSSNMFINEKSKFEGRPLLEARTEISEEERSDYLKESESESISKSKTESDCDFSLNNTFLIDEKSSLLAKSQGGYSLETVEAQLKMNKNKYGDDYLRESKSESVDNSINETSAECSSNMAIGDDRELDVESKISVSILEEAQTKICENECDELKSESIDDPMNNTIEKSMTSSVDESAIELSLRIEEQVMSKESSLFEQHDSNENYDHIRDALKTGLLYRRRTKDESGSIISELFGEESQFGETLPFPKLRSPLLSEESNSKESQALKVQHEVVEDC